MFTDGIRSGVLAHGGLSDQKSSANGDFGDLLSSLEDKKDKKSSGVFDAEGYFGETKSMTGELADLYEQLSKWADMDVAEKIRAQYLEDNNLTEEGLAGLPPEERAAIEQEIAAAIKRHFGVEETGEAKEVAENTPATEV